MKGSNFDIIWATVMAIGGIWMLTIAIIGYFSRALDTITRLLFALVGFALLIPADLVTIGFWIDVGGLSTGIFLIIREIASKRRIEAHGVK